MLGWAILFLILTLVAGYFGFFAAASASFMIAKILFVVFLILLVVSGIASAIRGRPPV